MSRLAHRLALIGALSPLLLLINYVLLACNISAAIGGMDLTDQSDMDGVLADVADVTNTMGIEADRAAIGNLLSLASLCPFLFAVTKLRYRRRWAF